jgi:TonB-dependent starch-binding outer membrane protein SusC
MKQKHLSKIKRLFDLLKPGGFTLLLMFGFAVGAVAQTVTVSGNVTDEAGLGLPGVNILVQGTSTGTITDIDGSYELRAEKGATLVFTFTGYTSQSIVIGNDTRINVSMKPDAQVLGEVVVTGYTAQQKRDLTGAVGTVNTEDLKQIPSSNINSQLQGRVSGVTVSGDGRPGSVAKVRIRGFASFTGANDPLYIVDGVPTTDVSTLNPNDVENISVLKDAGAASIYGSRASNGVILITTKKGQKSGVKVSYDMYAGTQNPSVGNLNLLNAREYADLQWLVYRNDGTTETHPIYGESSNASPTLPSWAGDTDWFDVITRNALITNHDVSLSGGNESARFYAGLNYFNQEGIVITNFAKRYSARLNSEYKVAKGRLTIGENLTVTGRTGNGVSGNGGEDSPVSRVYMSQPIIPAIIGKQNETVGISHTFVEGEYGGTGIASRTGNTPNILADLERNAQDRQNDVRILGSIFGDLKLMEGLNFRSTFGGTYQSGYNTDWTGATYERAENQATSSYNENSWYGSDWVWTNTLTLDKAFGASRILAVAGYEAVEYNVGRGVSASKAGYFSIDPAFRTVTNGAAITNASSGFNTPIRLVSSFLRADYSFNNRYYLSGTIRRDGASNFGKDERYGIFPSVSAGVRVSDFFNTEFLSDMKIRGGYGTMGNQRSVSPFNQYNTYGGDPGSTYYDLNGTGSSSLQGFAATFTGNPDSKWETQITTNIGFDASLFNSKLQVSFDWYTKQAQDLLFTRQVDATYGNSSQAQINIGDMKNTGIDLQLDYRTDITPDLKLDATVTFTTYKNEITKITDNIDYFDSFFGSSRIGTFNRNAVGRSISEFYGYQVIGLFQSQSEVDGAPTQDGAEPGFFRYQDTDGDGEITPDDRVYIGNPNPDFTYGLNLGLTYKGFDLSAFFFGSQGNEIFNYNKWWLDFWPSFQNQKSADLLYNSWTPQNTSATTPKASNKSNFSNNTQSVSYYVENGSFLRMRNLQIGYTLPNDVIGRIGLSKARLYVQGVNLFTATKYSGIDPDINNGGDTAFGVDFGNYPLVKQFIFGLNVSF